MEIADTLEGHNRENLEAVMELVWRFTWKP